MTGGTRAHALSNEGWLLRTALLAAFAVALVAGLFLFKGPIPQPLAYHDFCDSRTLLGIPNALNVLSNLPFLLVGALGLAWLARAGADRIEPALKPSYAVMLIGVATTAFGSAYYHLAPGNETLFWDRLPMAVGFMGLYSAVLAERVSMRLASVPVLATLVLAGAATVVYWRMVDDLRPYAIAQFLPLISIPLVLAFFPARYTRGADIVIAIGIYAVAKAFEEFDLPIYEATGALVSGHTLKHLAAAVGTWWLYRMLTRRERMPAG
jgi:hypothetical protein